MPRVNRCCLVSSVTHTQNAASILPSLTQTSTPALFSFFCVTQNAKCLLLLFLLLLRLFLLPTAIRSSSSLFRHTLSLTHSKHCSLPSSLPPILALLLLSSHVLTLSWAYSFVLSRVLTPPSATSLLFSCFPVLIPLRTQENFPLSLFHLFTRLYLQPTTWSCFFSFLFIKLVLTSSHPSLHSFRSPSQP